MSEPDDRADDGRRAWARLLDLLAREVVRRLGPKKDLPDGPSGPPAVGADDGPEMGAGNRDPWSQ